MMSVMFPATAVVDDEQCITVTGIVDMKDEGSEFLGLTIDINTMDYIVDGGGFGFTESLTLIVHDNSFSKWICSI